LRRNAACWPVHHCHLEDELAPGVAELLGDAPFIDVREGDVLPEARRRERVHDLLFDALRADEARSAMLTTPYLPTMMTPRLGMYRHAANLLTGVLSSS
jgi:hypothetical protein